jgi:S-adenosylmethionine-dependent methyltransferase
MNVAHTNIWTKNAEYLEPAYLSAIDQQTSKLIVFGLSWHLTQTNCSIVDIGGGGGSQAALLAEMGHSVTVVDIDSFMLNAAERHFSTLDSEVKKRLHLVEGTAKNLLGGKLYDVVCCHSVLMYEENWTALLQDLAGLLRLGGLLSITCVNPEACAMRLGRQRRWREVIATITTGIECNPSYIPSNNISRTSLQTELVSIGIDPVTWYGVGVFEDGSSDESFAAEWLAGSTEPYRSVARSYHLLGQRVK